MSDVAYCIGIGAMLTALQPTSNPPSSGKAENTAATLKVLLVSDRETLSSDAVDPLPRLSERDSMVLLPLTLSRSTFEFVSSLLKLPKIYLPSLQRRISHCQQFNPDGEGLGAGYGPGQFIGHLRVSTVH